MTQHAIDHQQEASHVMVMDTHTHNDPTWDWLDSPAWASKVPNSFTSFVVRAPKTTLLSTKTVSTVSAVSNNARTSTPAAQHPQISSGVFRRRVRRDQLANGNKRRLLPLRPLSPIAEESSKTPARAAIDCCERGPGARFPAAGMACVGAGRVCAWGGGWVGCAERESAFM